MASSKPAEEQAIDLLRKQFGKEVAIRLADGDLGVDTVTPTGHPVLDNWVLGVGGLPRGRIVEISGPEGGGKTTLASCIMAAHQRDAGLAALNDTEHKFEPSWADRIGVDLKKLIYMQEAEALEAWLLQVECLLKSAIKAPPLFVLDSVADIKTQRELDEGVKSDPGMAEAARIWSQKLKMLKPLLAQKQGIILLINQLRAKPGVMYGAKEQTTGGNAIRYGCTTQIRVSAGKIKGKGEGATLYVRTVKHQVGGGPFRSCELKLLSDGTFDHAWSVLKFAREVGAVTKSSRNVKEAYENLGWTKPESVADEGDADEAA